MNGQFPSAGLIIDNAGNLYGTTELGGTSSNGVVFKVANGSTTIQPLASFGGSDGSDPKSPVIIDSAGNLYGTTGYGGTGGGNGTVFKLLAGATSVTSLGSFSGGTGGANPYGGLVMDSAGNLYGTTANGGNGGPNGSGEIFKLAAGSNTISVLASFNGTNGSSPQSALLLDGAGNLFGTTFNGGANNDGVVFELAHGSSTITALASFDGSNGQYSYGSLVADANGVLYGTTFNGGLNGDGVVFKVTNSGFVPVPEPTSTYLLSAGGACLALVIRRSQKLRFLGPASSLPARGSNSLSG